MRIGHFNYIKKASPKTHAKSPPAARASGNAAAFFVSVVVEAAAVPVPVSVTVTGSNRLSHFVGVVIGVSAVGESVRYGSV